MKSTVAALVAVSILAGCAGLPRGAAYVPLVDMKGVDEAKYPADLGECQAYATQRMDAAQGAMAGAVMGAVIGAILAPKGYRNNVAGRGALLGGLAGGAGATETQEQIVKTCLVGRGYTVLN